MPEVDLRESQFSDYPGIVELERAQGLTTKSFEEWQRLWVGNPCYERLNSSFPLGWVLQTGDRIVGCVSNIPLRYVFRGRSLLAVSGHGWAVEEQYRGYALMLLNEYFSQQNVDLFLDSTVNGKALSAFSTFGSKRVPVGDWERAAFKIVRHRGFAESALRIKDLPLPGFLSYPAGLALSLKDGLTAKPIPKAELEVRLAHDFDQRFDTFWEALSQRSDFLLAVRSREVLQWHFNSLVGTDKLWVLTTERGGMMNAYAIFQSRDEPKYGLKRMRLVDFQSFGDFDQHCAAFLRTAYDLCRARGIHVLENVGCDLTKTRVFDQAAPYRRELPGWCYFYLSNDVDLAHQLEQPGAWVPSSYDGDASL